MSIFSQNYHELNINLQNNDTTSLEKKCNVRLP